MTGDGYSLTGINRAMTILEAFESSPDAELSLADIARSAGLGEATTLRYVTSLATHRLLDRDPVSGRYRLGLRLFQLGEGALRGRDPRAAALPEMRRLCGQFEETVNLAVRRGDQLILIEVVESPRSIRRGASVGERDSWDTSALGRSILAHLDEDDARSLLGAGGRAADRVIAGLGEVRERGYALDACETAPDLRCVGAAIFDRSGEPRYALSVSGPEGRMPPETTDVMGAAVCAAAATISAALGHLPAVETELAHLRREPVHAR
jgi:IclR family acetate operon transcriptional repressor